MQETATVAAPEGPVRRRAWWPRILAVVVLVVAAVTLVRLGVGRSAEQSPGSINDQLVQRMTTVLEQTPAAHQGHGGHQANSAASAAPARTVCGARVYGYEPADAATADDVVTVYGFHMCGVAEAGVPWDFATRFVAPLVMRFDTDPPTVQAAESTADVTYQERIKQLIPVQYQQLAAESALEPDAMTELRRRYDEAAGV
jgi:hypothetical protein